MEVEVGCLGRCGVAGGSFVIDSVSVRTSGLSDSLICNHMNAFTVRIAHSRQ